MRNFTSETFVNHAKTCKAGFYQYEDLDYMIVKWEHRGRLESSFVRLVDLKMIFQLCEDNGDIRYDYRVHKVEENFLELKVFGEGEEKFIIFREYDNKLTVQFITKGLYNDKSDPCHWEERVYISEIGEEHVLTTHDLYRIRKMCKISDLD